MLTHRRLIQRNEGHIVCLKEDFIQFCVDQRFQRFAKERYKPHKSIVRKIGRFARVIKNKNYRSVFAKSGKQDAAIHLLQRLERTMTNSGIHSKCQKEHYSLDPTIQTLVKNQHATFMESNQLHSLHIPIVKMQCYSDTAP